MTRRSLAILLGLLALALPLQAAARPAALDVRDHLQLDGPAKEFAPAVSTRADTLFLFAASGPGSFGSPGTDARGFTFDDGAGGPATAGWTPVDLTVQDGSWWHLEDAGLVDGHGTDMSAAGQPWTAGDAVNDYALWCGRSSVCGWIHGTGYGNDWQQYVAVAQSGFSDSLRVNFAYNSDFEGDTYDFFTVEIEVDGQAQEVYRLDVSGEQTYQDLGVTIHAADFPGGSFGDVLFHFQSDGGWSDQDGSFVTDIGAVWLDNVELVADGVTTLQADFESGVVPAEFAFTVPAGAGSFGQLYSSLFSEDICVVNSTYAWAFFDLNTTNPEYPIPVTAYGPPYIDTAVRSPVLDSAHHAGDPNGVPLSITPSTQVNLEYLVYLDMPLNSLIFEKWGISAVTAELPCPGDFADDQVSYYGDDKIWFPADRNITLEVAQSANGGTITGLMVQLRAVDRCPVWCNQNGDGTGHTPAPYYDNVQLKVIDASAVAWNVDQFRRFQDNFPDAGTGKVRIDNSDDIAPQGSSTLVIGDSTVVELNMDLAGGIATNASNPTGENRPEFYCWFRVVDGPHAGSVDPAMGDPDDSDGIWSPHVGTASFNGITFNALLADSASYQGTVSPGSFAFDFNDEYFEAGDVIEFFYRAESGTGIIETRPRYATATNPLLRAYYTVRCLPTAGVTMLYCEDNIGDKPWWDEAFRYNGYSTYDVYTTQAPSSGLNNGLSGRAEQGDIDQYHVIVWDSSNLPAYTFSNALPEDKTFDTVLLDDWLSNSSHDTFLWALGCEIANDLGNSESFLSTDLGASLLFDGQYIDDVTGVKVPKVYATHPALEWLGASPTFWVDGGCPSVENFSVIGVNGALAQESHAWENDGGTGAVAGIYNRDPDGNGSPTSPAGHNNRTLLNPFGYFQIWDAGYGLAQGVDYSRKMVGDVLANLASYQPDTAPDAADDVPAYTSLQGNYPNPFNPTTSIRFGLAEDAQVNLAVYDLSGRRVRLLASARMEAGQHEIVWDGRDDGGAKLASGVYFSRLLAGDYSESQKMVLLK
ncbi:T9SS type A sorting domain-containing protein [bacterium]|nr:T9SS type A sorting domain-containing protein [bacterium]